MKVKAPYERTRVVTDPGERQTKCVQSERDSSDINNIMARAYKTGKIPVLMNRQPLPEMPDVGTYQDMLNKVVFAQQSFEKLPSAIRVEFENKPEKMLQAIEQSANDPVLCQKLADLGLVNPPAPVEPAPVDPPVDPKV